MRQLTAWNIPDEVAYRVRYQARSVGGASSRLGDWTDRETVVVAGRDARGAIAAIEKAMSGHELRFQTIEVVAAVDLIAEDCLDSDL